MEDDCSRLLRTSAESGLPVSEVTKLHAKYIKGLVDLVNGDVKSGFFFLVPLGKLKYFFMIEVK